MLIPDLHSLRNAAHKVPVPWFPSSNTEGLSLQITYSSQQCLASPVTAPMQGGLLERAAKHRSLNNK